MIFAFGVALFVFGFLTLNVFGSKARYCYSTADYIGAACVLAGALGIIASICMLAWRYLP